MGIAEVYEYVGSSGSIFGRKLRHEVRFFFYPEICVGYANLIFEELEAFNSCSPKHHSGRKYKIIFMFMSVYKRLLYFRSCWSGMILLHLLTSVLPCPRKIELM